MEELRNIEEDIRNTQVIVLAGGRAKRMGKIDKPKALLELNGTTLVDHMMTQLSNCGFKDFIFLTGYKHEYIENHVGDGSRYGVSVKYSVEPETVKGKGKALKYALVNNKIDTTKRALICFPDDLFLDKKLPIKFLLHHLQGVESKNTLMTALFVSGTNYPYGVGEIDSEQIVIKFTEKPFIHQYTSTGLYIVEPQVFDEIYKEIDLNSEGGIEFEDSVLPKLAAEKKVFAMIVPSSIWLSINTFKEYENAEKILNND
ncbi:MAG: hypothetical protein B6U88_01475 [Candidatus Aenigmarchaeota archaeon ex4484_56]|nr:MAG: hypothetical protein B6U88_01475 [Candidatus Aenigmarchaeota archaeon ex4484_56]